MKKENIKLYLSVITACITGVGISFFVIFVLNYSKSIAINLISKYQTANSNINTTQKIKEIGKNVSTIANNINNSASSDEEDQDPTFISKFSRISIYSADDNREIIESVKKSLPKSVSKKVTAKSYVVTDLDRDVAVLEKDSDRLMPIASITKIITAVVAKKLIKDNETIIITDKALATYGNEAKLKLSEKYKLKELLYPLLMVSSNDASEAIARHYGREEFIKEMNDFASSIGAYRTYFRDPSGLSPQNVSTTNDLTIITKWILKNSPEIFDITLLKSKTIRTHTWTNPTHFLNLDSYVGGKNGYTPEANRTSVALFKLGKQNRLYSVVFLGSSSRDADILDLLEDAVR